MGNSSCCSNADTRNHESEEVSSPAETTASKPGHDIRIILDKSAGNEPVNATIVDTDTLAVTVAQVPLKISRPAIPAEVLSGDSMQNHPSLHQFKDLTISPDSAAFVSYKPMTNALAWRPLQIVFMIVGICGMGNAVFFSYGAHTKLLYYYDSPCGGSTVIIFQAVLFAHTGLSMCVSVILARHGKPRYGVILLGLINFLWSLAGCTFFCSPASRLATFRDYAFAVTTAFTSFAFALWSECLLRSEERWPWRFSYASSAFLLSAFRAAIIDSDIMSFFIYIVWALVIGYPVASMLYRRRLALKIAMDAVEQDRARYDEVWLPIRREQEDALRKLGVLVSQQPANKKYQRIQDLKMLYSQAQDINGWYQSVVCMWAEQCHVEHYPAPVKTYQRALEKVHRSYVGKVAPLLDLVRSSVIVDTISEAQRVLECVIENAAVHVIKNRFDLAYDGRVTAGYRDLNLQISFSDLDNTHFDGFVFELQIHVRAIIQMKSESGHKRYVELRNLRGD